MSGSRATWVFVAQSSSGWAQHAQVVSQAFPQRLADTLVVRDTLPEMTRATESGHV